jgi:hypothetical protein
MWFQNYNKDEKLREYVVQMIGYCGPRYEWGHKQVSIYEYMPGGTLQHLHGELFHIVQSKSK